MFPSVTHRHANVCLILEGTYPYIAGGVSGWTHDLLLAQSDLKFHLMTLLPPNAELEQKYEVPENVITVSDITIQGLAPGDADFDELADLLGQLKGPLLRLLARGGLAELAEILDLIAPYRKRLGRKPLLDSRLAWDMLIEMYRETLPRSSFLDFFWSWRALLGGIYSVLLADLPDADVYHAVSTGYAGLMAARCHLEKKRPVLLTEHGIYTNERRIEMAMADWLYEKPSESFQSERAERTLKDLWVDTFVAYSHVCYEASSEIITLYEGNQQFQLQDGAPKEKLKIVPNGIDLERFSDVQREEGHPPTIALIGRVVPIKDVKTYIRACGLLREKIPDLQAMILGPTDEDEDYFRECQALVNHLGLEETIGFEGRVKLEDYMGSIDAIVLTSISEAQPLVILEAGTLAIPIVATNVGACLDMILGGSTESPKLGAGGAITELSNPSATAEALFKLLTDPDWYASCGKNICERVRCYYDKTVLDRTYRDLYETYGKVSGKVFAGQP